MIETIYLRWKAYKNWKKFLCKSVTRKKRAEVCQSVRTEKRQKYVSFLKWSYVQIRGHLGKPWDTIKKITSTKKMRRDIRINAYSSTFTNLRHHVVQKKKNLSFSLKQTSSYEKKNKEK